MNKEAHEREVVGIRPISPEIIEGFQELFATLSMIETVVTTSRYNLEGNLKTSSRELLAEIAKRIHKSADKIARRTRVMGGKVPAALTAIAEAARCQVSHESKSTKTAVDQLMTHLGQALQVAQEVLISKGMASEDVTRHVLLGVTAEIEESLWIVRSTRRSDKGEEG